MVNNSFSFLLFFIMCVFSSRPEEPAGLFFYLFTFNRLFTFLLFYLFTFKSLFTEWWLSVRSARSRLWWRCCSPVAVAGSFRWRDRLCTSSTRRWRWRSKRLLRGSGWMLSSWCLSFLFPFFFLMVWHSVYFKASRLFLPFYLFTFLLLNFSNWGNFSFQLGKWF